MTDVREIAENTDYSYTCSKEVPVLADGVYTKAPDSSFTLDYVLIFDKNLIKVKNFSVINSDKARTSSDHSPIIFDFEIA